MAIQKRLEREVAISNAIDMHPDWNHNRLKKELLKEGQTSNMTFEDDIKKMLAEEKILRIERQEGEVEQHYYITSIKGSTLDEKEFKKAMEFSVSLTEKVERKLEERYTSFSQMDRIHTAIFLIRQSFSDLNCLTLYQIMRFQSEVVCKPYETRLRAIIGRVIEIIRSHPEDPSLYPRVMGQVLPIYTKNLLEGEQLPSSSR